MITQLTDLPDGVLGFQAGGKVTGDDYAEILVPAVESALEQQGKISLLLVLGEEFDGYSAGAAWDDAKVGMEHLFSIERIAVATDHEAYRVAIRGFGFLIPAKVRIFADAELDAAREWVSAA
ncbi:MAG: STAS/SEC14 domain-containing protein [Thermoleophilia bacterium]|nr:STAS/SEC14 domain-containing protein [Thermoleophilia bacterium]